MAEEVTYPSRDVIITTTEYRDLIERACVEASEKEKYSDLYWRMRHERDALEEKVKELEEKINAANK